MYVYSIYMYLSGKPNSFKQYLLSDRKIWRAKTSMECGSLWNVHLKKCTPIFKREQKLWHVAYIVGAAIYVYT